MFLFQNLFFYAFLKLLFEKSTLQTAYFGFKVLNTTLSISFMSYSLGKRLLQITHLGWTTQSYSNALFSMTIFVRILAICENLVNNAKYHCLYL